MGEIRTWIPKEVHIDVLKKEIMVLEKRYDPTTEGTGHFNTAISVLQSRIKEIESELAWPYPSE